MSTNRFPTTCTKCRRSIDAGKGTHTGKVGRSHTYVCTGACDGSLAFDAPQPSVHRTLSSWEASRNERIQTLVRNAGDNVDAAWSEYLAENEWFDGEPEITASAKATFFTVASEYLNHPDILEARAFAAREAAQEAEAYMAEFAL